MTFLEFIEDDTVRAKVHLLRSYDNVESGTAVLEAVDTMLVIKQTLQKGGRVVLLSPDTEPLEFTSNNEV